MIKHDSTSQGVFNGETKHLSNTEKINPHSKGIDALPVSEILRIMADEDSVALEAVRNEIENIKGLVEDAIKAISKGGRIIYCGAGTSGRLGVMDAAEVVPTFGCDRFEAVIAGGDNAVVRAVEGAEDDSKLADVQASNKVSNNDLVVGLSASGTTSFVLSFLGKSRQKGARCWLVTCNETVNYEFIDGFIRLHTGPEIIAGSTRLKAATATKLVLNMLSTVTMIKAGGTYDGLMVDVVPTNEKLRSRAKVIVKKISGCSDEDVLRVLEESGMRPKIAILMLMLNISREEAEAAIKKANGSLRKALEIR